ncbi:methyltransferase small [Runella slithyformis DSM 19594]|uniref:tRNA1(Val) (adenine(37)-N6)-methyltransferase n=2 Tax=Runella TaxID=105 RepID=A0A7U4E7Z9_RUNSL|nr:methyltransferase small [Runella slithyformis DSM 19594]
MNCRSNPAFQNNCLGEAKPFWKMPRIPSPFFRFKQFAVWHDRSALKVCTEACILGAYADVAGAERALDIGTGTGLLALMAAQRNTELYTDAVEIEEQNYIQAVNNVAHSPFAGRISVHHSSIQEWSDRKANTALYTYDLAYDLIISNPPFFANHLRSPDQARNRALHSDTLTLEELAISVNRLLSKKGRFVVLLPAYETQLLTVIAAREGLWPTRQLEVFQRPDRPLFRMITTFERHFAESVPETLYIHHSDGTYSDGFQTLLKEYYLIF